MNRIRGLLGQSLWQSPITKRKTKAKRRFDSAASCRIAAQVDVLEQRLMLAVTDPRILAVGSDFGTIANLGVYEGTTGGRPGTLNFEFNPYPDVPNFAGGVRTAVGYQIDITGTATFPVVIVAPGPGLFIPNPNAPGPVRVFAAVNGTLVTGRNVVAGELITSVNPYPGFGGGIFVGAADFDRDGFHEVITGADQGGGPHVRIISISPFLAFPLLFDQFVYDPGFRGGVRVAAGDVGTFDVNGLYAPVLDGVPDLITAAGPGGGPHIRVFNGVNGLQFPGPPGSFFAYGPSFGGGVFVAAGDFNTPFATSVAEVVTGAGAGGGPHVRIIPLAGQNPNDPAFDLFSQFVFEFTFDGGVRVATAYLTTDLNGVPDGQAELIVGRGRGSRFPADGADIRVFTNGGNTILYQGTNFRTRTLGAFPSSGKFGTFRTEPLQIDANGSSPTDGVTQITTEDVQALVAAAIDRFEAAGVSDVLLDELGSLQIHVANLANDFLGLAAPGVVILDDDAAGFGWFVDPTPGDDAEFGADGYALTTETTGRVDLFTALLHELGHHLGLRDQDPETHPGHLMTGTLNIGERRLPEQSALDILFAGDSLLDRLLAPSLF